MIYLINLSIHKLTYTKKSILLNKIMVNILKNNLYYYILYDLLYTVYVHLYELYLILFIIVFPNAITCGIKRVIHDRSGGVWVQILDSYGVICIVYKCWPITRWHSICKIQLLLYKTIIIHKYL